MPSFPLYLKKKERSTHIFVTAASRYAALGGKKGKKKKKNRLDNWTAGQSFGAGKPNQTRARNDF